MKTLFISRSESLLATFVRVIEGVADCIAPRMATCLLASTMLLSFQSVSSAADSPRDNFLSVTAKNFDSGGPVSRQFHLHPESYQRSATIARTAPPRDLQSRSRPALAALSVTTEKGKASFADYVAADPYLDGVVVLHQGNIIFEAYPAMQPWQRHYTWSVTKVVTSAALSALVGEGLLEMSATVDTYLPEFKNTAWADTSLQDIANMASGIDCRDSDGYQDTSTCVYRMEEALGITEPTGETISFREHLRSMQRHRATGALYEYVSANTNVLMLVMEAVSGQSYAEIVRTRIWNRIGAESDALISISPEGHAYASGGVSARLRDMARFGLVYTDPEFADIASPVLEDLRDDGGIALSAAAIKRLRKDHPGDLPSRAGWQWDRVWDDGALFKGGYSGQGLYVDPQRKLVVAWFGTAIDFSATQTPMDSIARQIAASTLFAQRE
ncbi:MAG: serine hydrolase domain-containing protein [Congregibacter sp.]